ARPRAGRPSAGWPRRTRRRGCPCPAGPVPDPGAPTAGPPPSTCPLRAARRPPTPGPEAPPRPGSPLREVDVVGVVAGGGTVAPVVVPAAAGLPDLVEPDDVEHPEPAGVGDEVAGEPVAVVAVTTGGHATEAARGGGEVA